MIIEITKYKPLVHITHKELISASQKFEKNYCSKCTGLIMRHFLQTDDGYMDIFYWKSKTNAEKVKATFMQNPDALEFAKHLAPKTITMHNHKVLSTCVFDFQSL